jgi:hypothetical protein
MNGQGMGSIVPVVEKTSGAFEIRAAGVMRSKCLRLSHEAVR